MPDSTLIESSLDSVYGYLESGRLLPVLGEGLLQVEFEGEQQALHPLLAKRCAQALGYRNEAVSDLDGLMRLHLENRGYEDDVYSELYDLARKLTIVPPPWLLDFLRIDALKLVLTTSFHPLVEHALRAARGEQLQVFSCNRRQADDLPAHGGECLLYHLFGRLARTPDFVVSDADALEFLALLQDRAYRPERLFDTLRDSHLLLLGCHFPDWVTRFFLRISKGETGAAPRGLREFLVESPQAQSGPLTIFLNHYRRSTKVLPHQPQHFVQQLSARWWAQHPLESAAPLAAPNPKPSDDDPRGAVFISYASEDREAARRLGSALAERHIKVWFDRSELKSGDLWESKIHQALAQCALFMPLISQQTDARLEGFFRREWHFACERAKGFYHEVPFILPICIDALRLEEAKVPAEFKRSQGSQLPGGAVSAEFAERVVQLMRDDHARNRP